MFFARILNHRRDACYTRASRKAAELILRIVWPNEPIAINSLIDLNNELRRKGLIGASSLVAQAIIDQYPSSWDGYGRLAEDCKLLNRFDRAVAVIERGLSVTGDNLMILRIGHDIHRSCNRLEDAIAWSTRLVTRYPSDPDSHLRLANDFASLGRHQEGLNAISTGLINVPNDLSLLVHGSIICRSLGLISDSLSYANKIISAYPNRWDGYARAGEDLAALGMRRRAFQIINKGIRESRHIEFLLDLKSSLLCNASARKRVAAKYRTQLRCHPTWIRGHIRLASFYAQQGKLQKAKKSLRNAECLASTQSPYALDISNTKEIIQFLDNNRIRELAERTCCKDYNVLLITGIIRSEAIFKNFLQLFKFQNYILIIVTEGITRQEVVNRLGILDWPQDEIVFIDCNDYPGVQAPPVGFHVPCRQWHKLSIGIKEALRYEQKHQITFKTAWKLRTDIAVNYSVYETIRHHTSTSKAPYTLCGWHDFLFGGCRDSMFRLENLYDQTLHCHRIPHNTYDHIDLQFWADLALRAPFLDFYPIPCEIWHKKPRLYRNFARALFSPGRLADALYEMQPYLRLWKLRASSGLVSLHSLRVANGSSSHAHIPELMLLRQLTNMRIAYNSQSSNDVLLIPWRH